MACAKNETDHPNWIEFCDRQAKAAAADFAKALSTFVGANVPSENVRPTDVYKDFVAKFIDCFEDHFHDQCVLTSQSHKVPNGNILPLNVSSKHSALHNNEAFSDYSEHEVDVPRSKVLYKPFFRRLSFKGLRKGKAFFQKHCSDETDVSNDKHVKDKHSKTKLAKIVVECRKEGIVNYLMGENIDGCSNQKWEKCRLALVKTVGGYMLEFYSPPKVNFVSPLFLCKVRLYTVCSLSHER